MKTVIPILLFVAVTLAAPNYQERQIYFSEQDNVCKYGSGYDQIDLIISIDGFLANRVLGKTETYCREWMARCADRIVPMSRWDYITEETFLKFDETSTYRKVAGVLTGIIQKTILRSPAKIQNKLYDCAIVGNQQIVHFGALGIDHTPPEMHISCTTISQQTVQ